LCVWPRVYYQTRNFVAVFTLPMKGTLNDVSKLTHITWPGVLVKLILYLRRKAREVMPTGLRSEPNREMFCKECDVIISCAKRGHIDHIECESIEKIPAKFSFAGHGRKICVGGRYDADIDLDCLTSSYAF
jgi:hypothetical protein